MSESKVIELWECQSFNRTAKWQPNPEKPWATKEFSEASVPIEQITLPNNEWNWASEWEVVKRPGVTDSEGWEYASRLSRFDVSGRPPKNEMHKWSTVRRRLWKRTMRREAGVRAADIPKVMVKIQAGLTSIHAARVRIEEITKQAPEAAQSEQMQALVKSVMKNIADVLQSLDQISLLQQKMGMTQSTAAAAVKKLRNDVVKEETAIDKAINPGKSSPNMQQRDFLKLQKSQSLVESRGNTNMRGRNNSSPPRGLGVRRGNTFAESKTAAVGSTSTNGQINSGNNSNSGSSNSNNVLDIKLASNAAAGSTTKTVVKGGKGGESFSPAVLKSNSGIASGGLEVEEGVFVDRSKRELQIAEKFIPVDEATVMQEIIDDRDVEIKKVHKGLVEVNEMFQDLARLVKEQEVEINQIFQNAEEAHDKTQQALDHIVEADQLQKNGQCIIC